MTVAVPHHGEHASSEKAKRREARAIVGAYHRERLRVLLDHVREGFTQLDADEIEFELDDLIQSRERAAKQLWTGGSTDSTEPPIWSASARWREVDGVRVTLGR